VADKRRWTFKREGCTTEERRRSSGDLGEGRLPVESREKTLLLWISTREAGDLRIILQRCTAQDERKTRHFVTQVSITDGDWRYQPNKQHETRQQIRHWLWLPASTLLTEEYKPATTSVPPSGELDETMMSLILAHEPHYLTTWCHSQNHKYITYHTVIRGGSSHVTEDMTWHDM